MQDGVYMRNQGWPEFRYEQFKSTGYLLHMACQYIGKLKLLTPFEPQWANVALWLTSRGLTTGIIPYQNGKVFSIDLDMISHKIIITTSWGKKAQFKLDSMSVAQLTGQLSALLDKLKIKHVINPMPQEIPNPIAFNQDNAEHFYDKKLANIWWQILLKNSIIMQKFHATFNGKTQPIGLMWGTFDLRDVRYNGHYIKPEGDFSGYIRRNSANEEQMEVGWWSGSAAYPKPAYFAFIYPSQKGIENSNIKPERAHWDNTLMEFILDYDDLQKSKNPERDLLDFFETTYNASSKLAAWKPDLINTGKPI